MSRFLALLLITSLACHLVSNEASGGEEAHLRAQLILHQALPKSPHGEHQLPTSPTAWLSLERRAGVWYPVIASAPDYSQHEHRGWLVDWQQEGNAIRAEIRLRVRGDAWTAGGGGHFRIMAELDGAGNLSGSYEGSLDTNQHFPVSGAVSGSLWPSEPQARAPLGRGVHPRLLFAPEDLQRIRELAASPLGQAALAQMEDSIAGLAFRHALTGDVELAAEVRRRLDLLMDDADHGPRMALSRYYPWRLEQAALAFDLCYHAWDAEYRMQVANYMRNQMNVILHNRGVFNAHLRWGHRGPHAPPIFYATGIAALAIEDEPGPSPARPRPPILIDDNAGEVAGVDSYDVPDNVPQHDFASGVMPENWLYIGAFPSSDFPAGSLSERAALRPRPGDTLGEGESQRTWRTVEPEKLRYQGRFSGNQPRLLLTGPSGVATYTNSYYYSVLNNDAARWVQVHLGHGGVEMVLSGVALREGDVIHLQPGRHPWLLTGPLGHMNPWAKSFAEPKLVEIDEQEVARLRQQSEERYAADVAEWQRAQALWQATDGSHLEGLMLARTATHIMDIVFREMLGTGGFLVGGVMGLDGPNKYAFIHRQVRGYDAGRDREAAMSLIRTAFVHPYAADRDLRNQEISGRSGFITGAYPEGGRDLASENFAALWPLLPQAWQGAGLWLWQYHLGGDGLNALDPATVVTPPQRNYLFRQPYGHFHIHPLFALLTYPQDGTAQHPEGILPLTWAAPDAGFYGFRNHWQDRPDRAIVQVFAATPEEGAGTLRLFAFNQAWSHGPGFRQGENVVQIPDRDLRADARAQVLHLAQDANGSGSMLLDLSPVYADMVRDDRGRPLRAYDHFGAIPRAGASTPSGISGQRGIGIDYSGRSGAPVLLVLSDTVDGVDSSLWTWQLEGSRQGSKHSDLHQVLDLSQPGRSEALSKEVFDAAWDGQIIHQEREVIDDERVRLHQDGFTLQQDGATLRATVLSPMSGEPQFLRQRNFRRINFEVLRIEESLALTIAGSQQHLVVLTVQAGDAPTVERQPNGSIRVGEQTITIDADGIISFGDTP